MAARDNEIFDAKIEASEAKTETKIARLEGKMDLVISKLDNVLTDNRVIRTNMWVIAGALAALMVGLAFGLPAIFDFGARFHDMVRQEVQQQQNATSPAKQP